jgi:hypothetical protein
MKRCTSSSEVIERSGDGYTYVASERAIARIDFGFAFVPVPIADDDDHDDNLRAHARVIYDHTTAY